MSDDEVGALIAYNTARGLLITPLPGRVRIQLFSLTDVASCELRASEAAALQNAACRAIEFSAKELPPTEPKPKPSCEWCDDTGVDCSDCGRPCKACRKELPPTEPKP